MKPFHYLTINVVIITLPIRKNKDYNRRLQKRHTTYFDSIIENKLIIRVTDEDSLSNDKFSRSSDKSK